MDRPRDALSRFGERVADAQDTARAAIRPTAQELARGRLLGAPTVPAPPHGRSWLLWGVIPAAAAAAAVLLVVLRPSPALRFEVAGAEGMLGGWLSVHEGASLPVRFSDGSTVRLEANAQARVVAVDEAGARVVLEHGLARVSIVPRRGARWRFDVGPFGVLVTGTRFDVGWDAREERFTLTLHEGEVIASGPLLGRGRSVRTGETLRVWRREGRLELVNGAVASLPAVAPSETTAPQVTQGIVTSSSQQAGSRSALPRVPGWRELLARGSYREAIAAAEATGFDRVCREASALELYALGDAGRFAGSPGRSAQAFDTLRRRFPSDVHAPQAAFALGRLAFDARGAYAEAARWFSTSLAEQPSGPLAREAAGRLIEARSRAGDASGARDAARRYLERYPSGPHADLARSLAE